MDEIESLREQVAHLERVSQHQQGALSALTAAAAFTLVRVSMESAHPKAALQVSLDRLHGLIAGVAQQTAGSDPTAPIGATRLMDTLIQIAENFGRDLPATGPVPTPSTE